MTIEYALIATVCLCIIWLGLMEYRLYKFFKSKNGGSLEGTVRQIIDEIETMQGEEEERIAYLRDMETRLRRSIQGVSTVRFNPFREVGSKQSFATALLNQHGDGVVISTLYSRDRTSVFAKPIRKFASEYELTPEETAAMEEAKPA